MKNEDVLTSTMEDDNGATTPNRTLSAEGLKFDHGKPRMDLLDPYAITKLAEVLTFGAQKYEAHNWRKGIAYSRLTAAALRHMTQFMNGQDYDEETGLPHPAHAMCCMMFLIWMMEERDDLDDRWKQ